MRFVSIRNLLSYDACYTIMYALFSSRLDELIVTPFCITFLRIKGINCKYFRINARILRNRRAENILPPVLKNVHLLKDRITYTILMLTYKSYYNIAPSYLCEVITRKESYTTIESTYQKVNFFNGRAWK